MIQLQGCNLKHTDGTNQYKSFVITTNANYSKEVYNMRINHNIPALRALHQLDKSNSKLDRTLERLSSGLRINHAADDAAGLAITQKMDTQVRGLHQANRNAMDGISLIQTAEGALNEVHNMLQRVRELSVQVSNGTYDAEDRKAVQDEVQQLQNEIERISTSIEFNEMKLLNGDIDRRAFSTDADIADIVSMSDTVDAGIYTFDVAQLASTTSDTGGVVDLFDGNGEATESGTLNINGEQIKIVAGDTSEEVFSNIRDLASRVDVSVSIEPVPPFGNGKMLKLEMNQYGPRDLEVTGDLKLLTALGLDAGHFQPNTASVYEATQDFDTVNIANTGNVLINGTSVAFTAGDDNEAVFDILRAANIPGVEVTYNDSGHVAVYTTKPLIIEAANSGAPADVLLAAEFTSDLAAGTALTGSTGNDLVKNIPLSTVDLTATLNGEITVEIGGSLAAPTTNLDLTAAGIGPIDLTVSADRDTFLDALNTVDPGNTIFTLTEDTPPKLTSYNIDGLEVTIKPLTTSGATSAADLAASTALGYANADIIIEKGFGNLGRNVQIDATSIIFDDPSTVNVLDGFPTGATVTTTGRDIVFQSNDNFELRLVSGTSTGTVTMNLLKTGPLDLQIGANEGQFMEIRIQNLSPRALGITDINLSTSEGAQEAIGVIDKAINTVSGVRSKLGAYQNRLEYTIANLESASENMTSSLSRILDADMALEMANFTQQNIIAQAGTSMLAQANQRPQSLLQLLQG